MSDQVQKVYILSLELVQEWLDGYGPEIKEETVHYKTILSNESDVLDAARLHFSNILDRYILELTKFWFTPGFYQKFPDTLFAEKPSIEGFFNRKKVLFSFKENIESVNSVEILNSLIASFIGVECLAEDRIRYESSILYGCVIENQDLNLGINFGLTSLKYKVEENIVGDTGIKFLSEEDTKKIKDILLLRKTILG
jgi:hypothetical protein